MRGLLEILARRVKLTKGCSRRADRPVDREQVVDQAHRDRTLANCRGDAVRRSVPDIPDGQDSWHAGLKRERRAFEHCLHVIAWWSEVFGGPTTYTDELGGYERMLAKHHDLAITPEQRFRFASLMSLTAGNLRR
jgi:hypothetical protein